MMKSLGILTLFLTLSCFCALTGVFFQPGEWYNIIAKPSWTPPKWLFGPAWTILYILIAVSAWLVWKKVKTFKAKAFKPYMIQLILNALWSPIFFGVHNLILGSIVIIALLASILWMILAFSQHSKVASYLLIPYLIWVSYASSLCIAITILNK